MHQLRPVAAVCKHLGDNVLLADVALGNALDRHAGLGRQRSSSKSQQPRTNMETVSLTMQCVIKFRQP
jgi:hypothetical protein